MDRSFFFAGDAITHRCAVGHIVDVATDEGPKVARPWPLPRAAHPAGGLVSSVRDQLRYARFWLGDGTAPDGTRLLRRESMDEMRRPVVSRGRGEGHVGVAWLLREIGGVPLVQHGGSTLGQQSAFVTAPAHGFAITVLTNSSRGHELDREAVQLALARYLGVSDQEPELVGVPEAALTG